MEHAPETFESLRSKYLKLAQKLADSGKKFTFSTIADSSYTNVKVEEDKNFTPHVEPIDTFMDRLRTEGMRVAVRALAVTIEAFDDDINTWDSIMPHALNLENIADRRLKELVRMAQRLEQLRKS